MKTSTKRIWRAVQIGLWTAAGVALIFTIPKVWHRLQNEENSTSADSDAGPNPIVIGENDSDEKSEESDRDTIELHPTVEDEDAEPNWDPEGVREFTLTERSGRTVTKEDLLGRPWAVCFIFTTCAGPCQDITNQMVELQRKLKGRDVRLVSISVDPKTDTPEQLKLYAENFGADPDQWWFLTGDQREIYELILHSFKLPVHEVTGADRVEGFQVVHSTNIMHVNAQGVVVGKYNGQYPVDMKRLRDALVAECEQLETETSTASDDVTGEVE